MDPKAAKPLSELFAEVENTLFEQYRLEQKSFEVYQDLMSRLRPGK